MKRSRHEICTYFFIYFSAVRIDGDTGCWGELLACYLLAGVNVWAFQLF